MSCCFAIIPKSSLKDSILMFVTPTLGVVAAINIGSFYPHPDGMGAKVNHDCHADRGDGSWKGWCINYN